MRFKLKKEKRIDGTTRWMSGVYKGREISSLIRSRHGGLWFCIGLFTPKQIIKAIEYIK